MRVFRHEDYSVTSLASDRILIQQEYGRRLFSRTHCRATVSGMEAVILAAGSSERMGGHKLTLLYEKKPLVVHAVNAALLSCSRVIVVTGFFAEEVAEALEAEGLTKDPRLTVVHNEDAGKGQYSSTLVGLQAVSEGENVAIAVADAPMISSLHYTFLEEQLADHEGVRVFVNGTPGHPMLCSASLAASMVKSTGVNSVREFLVGHDIHEVEQKDPSWVTDIDDPTSYMLLVRPCKF